MIEYKNRLLDQRRLFRDFPWDSLLITIVKKQVVFDIESRLVWYQRPNGTEERVP